MKRLFIGMLLVEVLLSGCNDVPEEHGGDEAHDGEEEHGHAEEGGHEEVVELSEEAVRAARIEVTAATESALEQGITMPARVVLDPRREALISVWMEGQVDSIAVRMGDTIKRGQILATVQSPELGEAIAAFRAASARDAAVDIQLERLKRLEDAGVAARAQVLESEADHAASEGALEAAEERLRIFGVDPTIGDPHAGEHYSSHVPVRSPISGKVLSADVSIGERVGPGTALFHVGDLDEVWLMLDVYERYLPSVEIGQQVRFTVEAWPGEHFSGRVDQIGDWIEPGSRTLEVRVIVDNPDHRLKPNMFAQAALATSEEGAAAGIVLPVDAVQRFEGAEVVFVEESPGHFAPRPVEIAARSAQQVQLSGGLAVGERVVTSGAFALKSELEKGELGGGHAH